MQEKNTTRLSIIILAGTLLIISSFFLRQFINRSLWYDEALTIMEFVASPPSYLAVYANYSIPNNHILYSLFMRFWLEISSNLIVFSNSFFRLPSLIASLIFLIVSFFTWQRYTDKFSAFFTLAIFALSPLFAIYATAVRGYAFSLLFVSLAITAILAVCENRKFAYPIYILICIISAGIMPNNAVAIFAVSLLPFALNYRQLSLQDIIKFCLPPWLGLLVFYLPILPRFIKVISIKEGWTSPLASAFVFYGSVSIQLLPLLILAIFAITRKKLNFKSKSLWFIILILLMPLIFFLTRSPAPFPRTFICILPVWLFLFSYSISKIFPTSLFERLFSSQRIKEFIISGLALALATTFSMILSAHSENFSRIISKYGQDDSFKPYFMHDSFNPEKITSELIKLTNKTNGIVFVDQNSDPPSIVLCAKRFQMTDEFILHDRPTKKIEIFPENDSSEAFIVAQDINSANSLATRFNLKIISTETTTPKQTIFRARK